MENRLTFRDLVLLGSISIVALLLLLTMYMVDRQWRKMTDIEHGLSEQSSDMRDMRARLRGLESALTSGRLQAANGAGQVSDSALPPAFARAAAAAAQEDFASGDWLVQALGSNLQTITPLVSSDVNASTVQSYVLETLLTRNPDTLEWEGLLARDWQISDDGMQFTFNLRDGLRFSDGKALTAEDVAFSFSFIMDERIAAPRHRAYFEKIASVEVTGPLTVTFVFKEPYFNSLALAGGLEVLPKHFYQPYLEKPDSFNQSKGLLLGSGPYRLKDPETWSPDLGLVELERNPRYWGPITPPFDRLMWRVIANDAARLTTYRNGDIDAYGARPVEYQKLRKDKDLMAASQQLEYMSPTAGYSYIAWNQERGGKKTAFADQRVRQALTLLTDRERIIKEIMLGYAEVAISPFNPRSRQHNPALSPRRYDREKALALLNAAGYADRNGDNLLEDKDGRPLRFELTYFQDSEDTKRIVLYLKDAYAAAGIEMVPKPSEWPIMVDALGKQDFDAITLGWSSGVETDIYQMFHSDQAIANGDNFVSYRSPELDKLIDAARATVDEDTRMPLWQQAERVLHEEQPYTFLMRRKTLAFIDKRFRNVEITKLGLNSTAVPIEWYVPKPAQRYPK